MRTFDPSKGVPVAADPQAPMCMSCHQETNFDGDSYTCEDCGLYWDPADLDTALYLDDRDEPCGAPCGESWHETWGYKVGVQLNLMECTPCVLPKAHQSDHYTTCSPRPVHGPLERIYR